jgi:hypothetical protein
MKLMTLAVAVATTVAFAHCAQARAHRHYRHHHGDEAWGTTTGQDSDGQDRWAQWGDRSWREVGDARPMERGAYRAGRGSRPRAWCGWEMRQLVGSDPGSSYNLARNWAHWGHAGPVGVGAVVVWPHHVGKIVGQEDGQWVIESGNDGHRVRTRPRSIAGAIAIRWG